MYPIHLAILNYILTRQSKLVRICKVGKTSRLLISTISKNLPYLPTQFVLYVICSVLFALFAIIAYLFIQTDGSNDQFHTIPTITKRTTHTRMQLHNITILIKQAPSPNLQYINTPFLRCVPPTREQELKTILDMHFPNLYMPDIQFGNFIIEWACLSIFWQMPNDKQNI